jgi:hypothetical protein
MWLDGGTSSSSIDILLVHGRFCGVLQSSPVQPAGGAVAALGAGEQPPGLIA